MFDIWGWKERLVIVKWFDHIGNVGLSKNDKIRAIVGFGAYNR